MEIDGHPAWRGVPQGLEAVVEHASRRTAELLMRPVLTPAEAEPGLAEIVRALDAAATEAARHQVPGAVQVSLAESGSLVAAQTALSATWKTASAAPGGLPAAHLPAARRGDLLWEACGGPNAIVSGCETVLIG